MNLIKIQNWYLQLLDSGATVKYRQTRSYTKVYSITGRRQYIGAGNSPDVFLRGGKMRNFEERMIRKSRNLKHKRKLPRRVLIRLARAFDRGGFIPLFESRADNCAIEGFCAQWHLQRTRRKKGASSYHLTSCSSAFRLPRCLSERR